MKKFVMVDTKTLKNERFAKDPELKREYERQKPLFDAQRAIIDARLEQGLSQRALAHKIGISPSDLSKIERGEQNTTIQTLYKIADVLNKDVKISFV